MGTPQALSPGVPAAESLEWLEELYARYRADPASVPPDWRAWLAQLEPARPGPQPHAHAHEHAPGLPMPACERLRLFELVQGFRTFGHRAAFLDPLADAPPPERPELQPASYAFSDSDLDQVFETDGLFGLARATLRDVLERLRKAWCGPVGVEFMHIDEPEIRRWIAERMEGDGRPKPPPPAERRALLGSLVRAEVFEQFLQTRFLGVKRFSLEGGESLVPLLERMVEVAGGLGADEILLAMPHRGRLNVLANVLAKPVAEILRQFQDLDAEQMLGRGDVKYHLGHSADRVLPDGRRVHLSLAFNPSHLEAAYPVVEGRVRARQDRAGDAERRRKVAVVLHGDASFAGQGVVAECLNYSQLAGYGVGGTLHVVVNNQIGFTTLPEEGRSSLYATGLARMLDIPIFHVNGADPEAVVRVAALATEFRHRFGRDVVIDLLCWRKYGHNEGDEPAFTQPLMYDAIARRPTIREGYSKTLADAGVVSDEESAALLAAERERLDGELARSRQKPPPPPPSGLAPVWARYRGGPEQEAPSVATGVARERLQQLARRLVAIPDDFEPHRKIRRGVLELRAEMGEGRRPLDWGMAEALALATLLTEGVPVRLAGQDTARGTFSHRHAVLHDARNGRRYAPLANLQPGQAPFEPVNSPLSEFGALGFEYGYSLDYPEALVVWEAQFGDFVNGAQIIVDQFLSSAEDKWGRLSGLVLLLPHGFEGQGPEHSSARLERFLNLSAEDNWQVCNPTTPAQYFHLLRRQVLRPWRKPLVVLTPKSLLRAHASTLDDLAGEFQPLLGDRVAEPGRVRQVLLSTGKVAVDLERRRAERRIDDTALLRLEQLYPFPHEQLAAEMRRYPNVRRIAWVQEEPWNMGAWFHLRAREEARRELPLPLEGVTRAESASPATGSHRAHAIEQERLLEQAFGGTGGEARAAHDHGDHGAARAQPAPAPSAADAH